MSLFEIGLIGLAIMIIILFSGMHIGLVMGIVGFLGFAYVKGWNSSLTLLGSVPYTAFANYDFSVFPLFVLMGEFCFFAKISSELYDTAYKWIGHLPGGLAIASIGACAGFAAICGSSVATAATLATVALPEMKKRRYDAALASGCLACGGTLGTLIPPSLGFVIYGIIAEQSIGKLFIAGIIPGIILTILFMAVVYVICRHNPLAGMPGVRSSWKERLASIRGAWIVFLLFLLVMGGIYMGLFSATEAAGVGAFGAFVFAVATRRLSFENLRKSLNITMKNTAMGFIIIAGAMIFGYFLAVTRLPTQLANSLKEMQLDGYMFIVLVIILYIFLGCIMDTIAMKLLTIPIFLPLVEAYGFDLIWFGVIVTLMGEIAVVTPPVGINVFIIQGIAKDVPMYTIFRGIGPFLVANMVAVVLVVVFPTLATWLPATMMK
jgi:C4-dicarboxylate transporter DctM subunit